MSSVPDIQAHFDRIAAVYDGHAALEQEVGRRLAARTVFQQYDPSRIVDLGCGTGSGAADLKSRYPGALVAGLDFAPAMLARARRRSRLLRPVRTVCADIGELPLAAQSVDLVFSNMAAFWSRDPVGFFAEVRRVLRPGGMFLFSTLGRDTFSQMRAAWAAVDPAVEVPAFPDILEIGDALAAAGFAEPTLDTDFITLEYPRLAALCEELEATGSSLLVRGWARWSERETELEQAWRPLSREGKYPLGYEIVYGAAFGPPEPARRRSTDPDVITVPVDSLLKSRPLAIVESGAFLKFA
ncbi:MAG: methyltransferase domain-containing protein [Xanthomonadales bacterium]